MLPFSKVIRKLFYASKKSSLSFKKPSFLSLVKCKILGECFFELCQHSVNTMDELRPYTWYTSKQDSLDVLPVTSHVGKHHSVISNAAEELLKSLQNMCRRGLQGESFLLQLPVTTVGVDCSEILARPGSSQLKNSDLKERHANQFSFPV